MLDGFVVALVDDDATMA
jgi:hypothetical protein